MNPPATLAGNDPILAAFVDEVGPSGPVAAVGGRTRWELGGTSHPGTRLVGAPTGIVEYVPEEMTLRARAGTTVAEVEGALAARNQRCALPRRSAEATIGGAVAVGENHLESRGRGALRASVLQVRYVSAEGRLVTGGGPTVKNVTGFDLPRLLTGSLGTLGLLAEVTIRTNPRPPSSRWLVADDADPFAVDRALLAPGCVLFDGRRTWLLLEGHRPDVLAQAAVADRLASFEETDGPPPLPPYRWSLAPAELASFSGAGRFVAGIGTGLVFADSPQPERVLSPAVLALTDRLKVNFDPTGRLNPGRSVVTGR